MFRKQIFFACSIAILSACSTKVHAADPIWIEGESPVGLTAPAEVQAPGRPEYLSGGKWLSLGVKEDEVDKNIAGDAIAFSYKFDNPAAGKRELWVRVGYEYARSPFQWRLDGGDWTAVKSDALTTDLVELVVWNEVAWLKLADIDPAAGQHTFDIQVLKTKDDKGKRLRILFGLDVICIADSGFHPYGRFRPGEDWRDDADRKAGEQVFKFPESPSNAAQASR